MTGKIAIFIACLSVIVALDAEKGRRASGQNIPPPVVCPIIYSVDSVTFVEGTQAEPPDWPHALPESSQSPVASVPPPSVALVHLAEKQRHKKAQATHVRIIWNP